MVQQSPATPPDDSGFLFVAATVLRKEDEEAAGVLRLTEFNHQPLSSLTLYSVSRVAISGQINGV